ncbi:unnamed protein product, partial [Coccothraustes coccothraustes]
MPGHVARIAPRSPRAARSLWLGRTHGRRRRGTGGRTEPRCPHGAFFVCGLGKASAFPSPALRRPPQRARLPPSRQQRRRGLPAGPAGAGVLLRLLRPGRRYGASSGERGWVRSAPAHRRPSGERAGRPGGGGGRSGRAGGRLSAPHPVSRRAARGRRAAALPGGAAGRSRAAAVPAGGARRAAEVGERGGLVVFRLCFSPPLLPPGSSPFFLPSLLPLPAPSVTGLRNCGCLKLNVIFTVPAGVC